MQLSQIVSTFAAKKIMRNRFLLFCMLWAGICHMTVNADNFSWRNATVYFVITDRFCNGDTTNDHNYDASLLNISAVYLNEVVKAVTGMNVTVYIKNEVVLQAKRLLVHTDLTVKEISYRLGIRESMNARQ